MLLPWGWLPMLRLLCPPPPALLPARQPACAHHSSNSSTLRSSPGLPPSHPLPLPPLLAPAICCSYETSSLYCADVFNTFLPIEPDHW